MKTLLLTSLVPLMFFGGDVKLVRNPNPTNERVLSNTRATPQRALRVPAEWETHESTWMQWPRWYESSYRPAFADIIDILQDYEPMHIIANSVNERNQAQNFLLNNGVPLTNVTFHVRNIDSAWMRDNGPVWVERRGRLRAQDWGFDGWGGLTPDFQDDDLIPEDVGMIENVPVEDWNHLIHERGDLEFNGNDAVIVSLPCFGGRNPSMTQAQLTQSLKDAFGVDKVVWLLTAPPGDVTGGHVDGIARFIDEDTVVVPRYTFVHPEAAVYDDAAAIIQAAGFQVLRMDVLDEVFYAGEWMSAIYVNWLVANGVVLVPGFNDAFLDNAAKQAVEGYFPNRDVHIIDTRELWYWGGSIHCVTNDQPASNSSGR